MNRKFKSLLSSQSKNNQKKRISKARHLITHTAGLALLTGGMAQAVALTKYLPPTPGYQGATISGQINYAAIGASFRTANGDNNDLVTANLCGVRNPVAENWNNYAVTRSSGANVLSNQRTSQQQVPSGSTVKAAYLYWTGSSVSDGTTIFTDNQVTFRIGTQTFNITAGQTWTESEPNLSNNSRAYGAFTSLSGAPLAALQTSPNADLGMDNLTLRSSGTTCDSGVVFGGWSLYLVYENPTESFKSMYLFHGLNYSSGTTTEVSAEGLLIPDAGNDKVSKITTMVSDGDPNNTGDKLTIDLLDQSGSMSSFDASTNNRANNNFFKGFVSYGVQGGASSVQGGTTPNVSTTLGGGLDLVTLDIANQTQPTTQKITAKMASGASSEMFVIHNLALMTTINRANVKVVKTLESSTGNKVGDNFVYKLVVDNASSPLTEAYKVVTTDTLPKGLSYVSSEISYNGGASYSNVTPKSVTAKADGTTVVVFPEIHRIDKNGTVYNSSTAILGTQNVVYRITAKANGEAWDNLINRADVTTASYESDTDKSDNNYTTPITVQPPPTVLTITKTDNDATFAPGGTGTYKITVKNTGAMTTAPIQVSDLLPDGMSFQNVTTTTGGSFGTTKPTAGATGTVGWTFTPSVGLASGQQIEFTVTVNVASTVANGTTLRNYAAVNGGGDPDPTVTPGSTCTTNQCSYDDTLVQSGAPALTITKTDNGLNFTRSTSGGVSAATYTLTVTNSGTLPTSGDIVVKELLPTGLTYNSVSSSSGTVTASNTTTQTPTFTVTNTVLQPGQGLTLTLVVNVASLTSNNVTNKASVGGGGGAAAPDPSDCTTTVGQCGVDITTVVDAVNTARDVQVLKTARDTTVSAAGTVTYDIEVRYLNSVDTVLTGISFSDIVPANLTNVTWTCRGYDTLYDDCDTTTSGTSATGSGNSIILNNIGLYSYTYNNWGDRLIITVTGTPTTTGTFVNTATVSTPSGTRDTDTTNNTASATVTVVAPDLKITKSHTGNFTQDVNGTYTIRVDNVGTAATSGAITVTDQLPAGMKFVSATAPAGQTFTTQPSVNATGTLTFTWTPTSPLAATNGSASFTITVKPDTTTASSVTNTASVSGGGEPTVNNGNNSASDPTTVNPGVPTPDLTVTKTHSGTWTQGDTGKTYTLTVKNSGTASTSGTVSITDTLPIGLTATAISGTNWNCTLSTLTCTRSDTLVAGNSYPPITLTVDVSGTAPASMTNTATVSGGGETKTTNNTATDPTSVISTQPDLTINKTATPTALAGSAGAIQYTVKVWNSGAGTVTGASITDVVPTGVTVVSALTCTPSGTATCGTFTRSGQTVSGSATLPPDTGAANTADTNYITLTFSGTAASAGTYTNTATVAVAANENTGVGSQPNTASASTLVSTGTAGTVPLGVWSNSACLDFSGISMSVGDAPISRSITTAEGLTVNYTIDVTSNAKYGSGGTVSDFNAEKVLNTYTPGTYSGDLWDNYFGSGKTNALYNNPVGRLVDYTLSAYATYNGQAVPLTLLTGSAEADSSKVEYVKMTTNGSPFAVVERVMGSTVGNEVIVTNSGTTVQGSVNAEGGNFMLFATTKNDATASTPLILANQLAGFGATAQGFCVATAFDRGDNPTSYTRAAHLQTLNFGTGLSNGTYDVSFASLAPVQPTYVTSQLLGGQPNAEPTERGTDAASDLDDALPTLTIVKNVTTYTLQVPYSNTSATGATVAGWIDFNGNGTFESNEQAVATAVPGTGTVKLTWSGITVTDNDKTSYARFRIGSNAAETSKPGGTSINGEVEDYQITWSDPPPVLTLDKTVNSDFVKYTGTPALPNVSQLVYTLTVTNAPNTSTAQEVTVTDVLPTGLTYSSSIPAATVNGQTLTWNIGNLNSGSSQVIKVTVDVPKTSTIESTQPQATWTNTAKAKATNAAEVSDSAETNSVYSKLSKKVRNVTKNQTAFGTSGEGYPGDMLEYCIDFSNYGSVNLPKFVITDNVPEKLTAILDAYGANQSVKLTRTGPPASTSYLNTLTTTGGLGSGVMTADVGTLAVGETGSACFQARIK